MQIYATMLMLLDRQICGNWFLAYSVHIAGDPTTTGQSSQCCFVRDAATYCIEASSPANYPIK